MNVSASSRASRKAPLSASPFGATRRTRVACAEPGFDALRDSAGQRNPCHTQSCEARGDRVDVPGGEAHELAGRNVVAQGVFQYGGGQLGKVARMRLAHPAHDRMRIGTEAAV